MAPRPPSPTTVIPSYDGTSPVTVTAAIAVLHHTPTARAPATAWTAVGRIGRIRQPRSYASSNASTGCTTCAGRPRTGSPLVAPDPALPLQLQHGNQETSPGASMTTALQPPIPLPPRTPPAPCTPRRPAPAHRRSVVAPLLRPARRTPATPRRVAEGVGPHHQRHGQRGEVVGGARPDARLQPGRGTAQDRDGVRPAHRGPPRAGAGALGSVGRTSGAPPRRRPKR